MKAFSITEEQIARCIGAACADELSREFNRHTDFLTIASWTGETPFGAGGLSLDEAQMAACAKRIATLFGIKSDLLPHERDRQISDWAAAVKGLHQKSLTEFAFTPAGRAGGDTLQSRHRADIIFQDAAAAANLLYGRRRLLSLVAPHSLFGFLISVLTPNLQNIESIDVRGMTPSAISQSLKFGDALVATPTLWRYMIREDLKAPDNAMGVSFGEPLTSNLLSDMRKAGFGAHRELYGSTETGLIGWRDSPGELFLLFDHWRKDGDGLCRVAPWGEHLRVDPMDILEWEDEKRFHLGGRRDGAIQIGAVNVFPEQIARTICSHPSVHDCYIRVGKQSGGVNRLIANIVLEDHVQPNERTARDIDAWCRANLRQQERPRIYNFELLAAKKSAANSGAS